MGDDAVVDLGTGSAYILLSAPWAPTSSGDMKSFSTGDGQSARLDFGGGFLGSVRMVTGEAA